MSCVTSKHRLALISAGTGNQTDSFTFRIPEILAAPDSFGRSPDGGPCKLCRSSVKSTALRRLAISSVTEFRNSGRIL